MRAVVTFLAVFGALCLLVAVGGAIRGLVEAYRRPTVPDDRHVAFPDDVDEPDRAQLRIVRDNDR